MLPIRPPFVSLKRGNMSLITPIEKHEEQDNSSFSSYITNYTHFATFGTVYILSFLVNLKVLHIVCSHLRKRAHSVYSASVLVAQLSIICIGITALSIVTTFLSKEVQFTWKPLGFPLLVFLEESLTCGFALNIALLLYERVCTVSRFPQNLFRIIGHLWILSCTQGFFKVGYILLMTLKVPEFKQGIQIAGIFCEILRYLVFQFSVGLFVFNVLTECRYLSAHLSRQFEGLNRRMERINAFRVYFYIFILMWISYGVWIFFHRISFILEVEHKQYSVFIDYTRLGFHIYITLNPMIYTTLIKPELTECRIENNSKERRRGNSAENVNIEEETAIDGDFDTTVRITYPETLEVKQTNEFSEFVVSVDVHSPPPEVHGQHSVKQFHLENMPVLQVQLNEESVITKSDKAIAAGKESNITEKQTVVRFHDVVDIQHYEKDTLAERKREYIVMLGEEEN